MLKSCVESILNQTYQNIEVWIIEGGSSDDTLAYVKSLKTPFNYISEADTSVYDAMNKGIEKANGEWLYFLGDDDKFASPDTLAKVFADKAYGENKLLIGNISYNYSNTDSYFLKKNDGTLKPSWSFKLWMKNSLHHQGLFYKNTLFKNVNYALEYGILSDYHFNLGLYKKQIKVSYLNQVIAICGTNGISKKYDWNTYKEEIQLKVSRSSKILQPLFFSVVFLKFLVKKKI